MRRFSKGWWVLGFAVFAAAISFALLRPREDPFSPLAKYVTSDATSYYRASDIEERLSELGVPPASGKDMRVRIIALRHVPVKLASQIIAAEATKRHLLPAPYPRAGLDFTPNGDFVLSYGEELSFDIDQRDNGFAEAYITDTRPLSLWDELVLRLTNVGKNPFADMKRQS